MDQKLLEIVKWVAEPDHEVEEIDSSGDTYGYTCAFNCGYDTTNNRNEHSSECFMRVARRKLA